MPRSLRFTPPSGLVEVTSRTLQGRHLLRPSPQANAIFLGVLGRALRKYDVALIYVVCMSNHFHALLLPRDSKALADFMGYFVGNLARKVNLSTGWSGPVFPTRYRSIPVSEEPEAMIARLRYLLAHGVKEDLVFAPGDWPGVQAARALADGRMHLDGGSWFDGTEACNARDRGEAADAFGFPEPERVTLAKLPCWAHLEDAAYCLRIREIVVAIEAEARQRHRENHTAPAGEASVVGRDPTSRPARVDRSPAPRFHTASREARRVLEEAYRWFAVAFYEAKQRLRSAGNPHAFPDGAFPPPQAFVAA